MNEQFPPVPPVPPPPAPAGDKKGLAIASLVLGILSLCAAFVWWCGSPVSIVGLVLGFLGLKSSGKGMAIAGIILSAVGLFLMIIIAIIGAISGPIFQQIQSQLTTMGY